MRTPEQEPTTRGISRIALCSRNDISAKTSATDKTNRRTKQCPKRWSKKNNTNTEKKKKVLVRRPQLTFAGVKCDTFFSFLILSRRLQRAGCGIWYIARGLRYNLSSDFSTCSSRTRFAFLQGRIAATPERRMCLRASAPASCEVQQPAPANATPTFFTTNNKSSDLICMRIEKRKINKRQFEISRFSQCRPIALIRAPKLAGKLSLTKLQNLLIQCDVS